MSREMKDSGVEWIGEIPKDWSIEPLGQYLKERNEKVSDREFEPLSVTKQGVMRQLDNVAKTDNNDNRKKVCKGDFVINSRSDRKQSCGLSELDGSVSVINIVLKNNGIEEKYLKYILKNYGFAEEFYRWGSGIVADLWSTKYEKMKRIMIPIPNNGYKIGQYLDKKVSQIDDIISKQKSLIEKYKAYKQSLITETVTKGLNKNVPMKDSGIEWIGEIPSKWHITRAKNILKKLNRDLKEDMQPVICSNSGKTFIRGDKKIGLISITENGYQGVEVGDLLIHGMDTWHGAIAISEHYGKCTPVVHVCDTEENKSYIAYYLKSLAYRNVYKAISNGVRGNTSDFRSWGKVGEIILILPSKDEQEEISDFLDKKCNAIDSAISKKEQLIEKLEAYKKSLIYECVTGKREVN